MSITITKKPWNISKRQLDVFSTKNIEKALYAFNRTGSGEYYMMDSFSGKIIVDSPNASILCGHPQSLLDERDFNLYRKILKKDEWTWAKKMNAAAHNVFFRYPISQRTKLVVSYDLAVVTADKRELVLHHKVVPYALCKNGNLWLRLCHVIVSASKQQKNEAFFTNTETNEQYVFSGNQLVLSDRIDVTLEDVKILEWLTKGFSDREMCLMLGNSKLNTFKSKKQRLFEKLEVANSAGAVHKAHLLGII